MPKRIKLDKYIEKKVAEDSIIIEAGGKEFTLPPAVTWSPDVLEMTRDAAIECLMGKKQFAEFVKAGGTAALAMGIVMDLAELDDMGESSAS